MFLWTLHQHPHRQTSVRCFSSSSSDVAPSLEDSIESGPLSDLKSGEEQSRRSVDGSPQLSVPLVDGRGCASLMKKLLDDIQDQNEGIWVKMEVIPYTQFAPMFYNGLSFCWYCFHLCISVLHDQV